VTRPGAWRRAPAKSANLLLILLLTLLIVALLAGGYTRVRPQVGFSNGLRAPVRLAAAQDLPRTVAPGESVRVPVPWGKTTLVTWELIRPLSADGKPMGEEIRGSVLAPGSWGTTRRSARARSSDGDYFAPLITNASEDLLRVTVNAGLEGSRDCGCAVRPGARRAFIGYYPLYQNSTVLARAGARRSAAFRNLGPQVVAPDGAIGLRFESKDLRAP
jgi:hypothetical protein